MSQYILYYNSCSVYDRARAFYKILSCEYFLYFKYFFVYFRELKIFFTVGIFNFVRKLIKNKKFDTIFQIFETSTNFSKYLKQQRRIFLLRQS